MEDLQVFKNKDFGEIRTVIIDNEPWFVGKDVAVALGYKDITHTILDHVDSDDRVNSKTQGQNSPEFGQRGTWLINESGMYSLIMSSKLPSAKKFKRWVTSEVLPSIRKNGGYIAGQETLSDEELLAKAILVAQRKIAECDKIIVRQKEVITQQSKTIEHQDHKLETQKPFVEFALNVQDSGELFTMEQAAKILSDNGVDIGRNTMMKLLRKYGILMENNSPYEKYRKAGLFVCKLADKENHYGTKVVPVTLVTGKGLIFINKKLREWYGLEDLDIDLEEFDKKVKELEKVKEEKELEKLLNAM